MSNYLADTDFKRVWKITFLQMDQDVQTSQANIDYNSLECIAPSKSHGCMLS